MTVAIGKVWSMCGIMKILDCHALIVVSWSIFPTTPMK